MKHTEGGKGEEGQTSSNSMHDHKCLVIQSLADGTMDGMGDLFGGGGGGGGGGGRGEPVGEKEETGQGLEAELQGAGEGEEEEEEIISIRREGKREEGREV